MLLKKYNVVIRLTKIKYKHTQRAFLEAFNKELAKPLFMPMDAQGLRDSTKVSTVCVNNLKNIVNKMNNTKLLMILFMPKDAIKLGKI